MFQNFNSSDPGDRAGDVRRGAHPGAAEAGACRESLIAGLKMRLQSAALKVLLIHAVLERLLPAVRRPDLMAATFPVLSRDANPHSRVSS